MHTATTLFGSVLADAGIDVVKIPPRCSRANCHAERFVGTVRGELSDRLLFVNQRHLTSVLYRYVSHYNPITRPETQAVDPYVVGECLAA